MLAYVFVDILTLLGFSCTVILFWEHIVLTSLLIVICSMNFSFEVETAIAGYNVDILLSQQKMYKVILNEIQIL